MVNTFHPPPEVVASFPKPNYVDPQTHGSGLTVLTSILTVLGSLVIFGRLYARVFVIRAFGIDDSLIIAALCFGIALSVLNIIGDQVYYNAYHVWDVPPAVFVPQSFNVWIAQVCFTLSLCCVKISVLLFYRRLSMSFTDKFLIAVWVGIIYNSGFALGFLLTQCLLCRPIQAHWLALDPTWADTHSFQCGSAQISEPLSGILSCIGDIYSAILPMFLVGRLHMPRNQKIALYFLFGLTFLAVITSVVRIVYLYRLVNVTYDYTWTLWEVWILTQVELWIALFAASAPALKPLVKRYMSRSLTTSAANSSLRTSGRVNHLDKRASERPQFDAERYVEISYIEGLTDGEEMLVRDSNLDMFYPADADSVVWTIEESERGDDHGANT